MTLLDLITVNHKRQVSMTLLDLNIYNNFKRLKNQQNFKDILKD
jgi:hypothetical protein